MTILIDNFSMEIEEWQSLSNLTYFSVDVTDIDYSISTSGTYFTNNYQIVSTTYSGITDGYRCFCSSPSIYNPVWTEKRPVGDVDGGWGYGASNNTGSILGATAGWPGRVYVSIDSGYSWYECQPIGDVDRAWSALGFSEDGSHILIADWWAYGDPGQDDTGRIYTSGDYGVSWVERFPVASGTGQIQEMWNDVASDADGSNLIVCCFETGFDDSVGRVYISVNYGETWTETRPTGLDEDVEWIACVSNYNGSQLVVCSNTKVYKSSNSGLTWDEKIPASGIDPVWIDLACDYDCSNLILSGYTDNINLEDVRVFVSLDFGETWIDRTPPNLQTGALGWCGVASDGDGSDLAVAEYDGRIYTSSDFGITWIEERPTGNDENRYWYELSFDYDGSNLIAGGMPGRLYTRTTDSIFCSNSLTIHAENSNSEILEQTFNFLCGYHVEFNELIDWGPAAMVITNAKVANLAFCPNTEGAAFYFTTKDLTSYNLGATIRAIESVDLAATIYPQSTFFFYGRTYTVTLSGIKDFAGNELAPFSYSFTIEDPTT